MSLSDLYLFKKTCFNFGLDTMPTYQNIVIPSDLATDLFKLDDSDSVDEDDYSKFSQSTSKNNLSKSETSQFQNST